MQILQIILPTFLIIGLGYMGKKYKIVEESWVHALNGFAYYIALPAVVISSLWQINLSGQTLKILFYNALVIVCFGALTMLALSLTKLKKEQKAAFLLIAVVGNSIYMGFPIAQTTFAGHVFPLIAAAGTIQLVLGIALGLLAVEHWKTHTHGVKTYLKDFFLNPLILALLAGLILSYLNFSGSEIEVLKKTISSLGSTASPVALFSLGAFIYGKYSKTNFKLLAYASTVKLILIPIFVFFFLKWIQPDLFIVNSAFLLAGMPAAATTFVLAEKFKLDKTFVAEGLLVTTALSFVSISILLSFLL